MFTSFSFFLLLLLFKFQFLGFYTFNNNGNHQNRFQRDRQVLTRLISTNPLFFCSVVSRRTGEKSGKRIFLLCDRTKKKVLISFNSFFSPGLLVTHSVCWDCRLTQTCSMATSSPLPFTLSYQEEEEEEEGVSISDVDSWWKRSSNPHRFPRYAAFSLRLFSLGIYPSKR